MKDLIERVKKDDLNALEELYQKVKSTGIKVAVSYVGQEGLEEDMFHEAFIKALENLDKFDVERSFQAWFDVILANTCKSHLRKKKTENIQDKTDKDGETGEEFEEISNIGNPEECWDQSELRQIIKDMLDNLSNDQKEAIILYYYQSMPVAQIAAYQNCGEDTVKSRLFQGRNKLKNAIEDYEKKANIKLHSIGVGTAIFVFFKSKMGDTYACESGVVEKATEFASQEVKNTAKKKAAEEVAKEAGKETAKEAAKEAGKAVAMKLSTKIAIGAVVAVLAGGAALWFAFSNQPPTEDTTLVLETTTESSQIVEPTEEPVVETVEETTEETVIEEVVEDVVIEKGKFLVEKDADGITRISVDGNDVGFSAANGGVIITYSETDGCGAIDYEGNEIVPNGYQYYYDGGPTNDGYFALGDSSQITVFDKEGNIVHSIPNCNTISLAEGYVTYSIYDAETYTGTVYCYDIKADNLTSYSIQSSMHFINGYDVQDGKYLIAYSNYDAGKPGIFYGTPDGEVTPVSWDESYYCVCPYGNFNGGYAYAIWTEMEGYYYLLDKDFSDVISFSVPVYYESSYPNSYITDGNRYYNRGTQMAFFTDALTRGESVKCYLLDLANYSEAAGIEACVQAEYDYIVLSGSGIYYAEENGENFYIGEDGTKIEDAYVDHSIFTDKYATVLDEDGLAYLIDAEFNVLTKGYEAEVVYSIGSLCCYRNGDMITVIISE